MFFFCSTTRERNGRPRVLSSATGSLTLSRRWTRPTGNWRPARCERLVGCDGVVFGLADDGRVFVVVEQKKRRKRLGFQSLRSHACARLPPARGGRQTKRLVDITPRPEHPVEGGWTAGAGPKTKRDKPSSCRRPATSWCPWHPCPKGPWLPCQTWLLLVGLVWGG